MKRRQEEEREEGRLLAEIFWQACQKKYEASECHRRYDAARAGLLKK